MNNQDKEDILLRTKQLRKYCYFHRLSIGALEELSRKLHPCQVSPGTDIIMEGSPADAFYFICSGKVDVRKKTPMGESSVLSVLGEGEGFGEMALLTCSPRSATVTAKTRVALYKLYKNDFDEIVRADSDFSRMLQEKTDEYIRHDSLMSLQPFTLLESQKMTALSSKLIEKKYAAGETVITQGVKGDEYYIIKSGSVEVLKKMFKDEPEKIATLGQGRGFGEEALITNDPRNAQVRALEDTVVLALSKNDFESILKATFLVEVPPENVPAAGQAHHKLLDVRMGIEYEEEHIPDSVNIPLDELRTRYAELDPDSEYYVYCLGGARSASAAFLLRMQGFNAKNIRGGISAWKGPLTGSADGVHTPFKPT
jgi:CRP-like cAMP-binding protein